MLHTTPLTVRLFALFFSLVLLANFQACRTTGSFYNCPRAASFYTKRYCFEEPKEKVTKIIKWMLKRYEYPVISSTQGHFKTKTVHMPRYSCGSTWGFEIGLHIKVTHHKGKIDLKGLPKWAFKKKNPPPPTPPKRASFKDSDAYFQAVEAYQTSLQSLVSAQNRIVQLMNRWRGCDIRTSKMRTVVEIDANILGYPTNTFGVPQKNKPAKKIRSRYKLEYSMLRIIGWKLGRLKYMRRMIK
ncbi:MAG TPA: hypothetical protein DCE42_14590 [Myxococcales bacterium]|nr:hypothetical protein [Deltaproteobacteria bacterium]MBU54483.1 hypothetical protein [Deltaproteobacteria bacterium]HAA55989.1 hypothetical protein [Myxococcales bacterium]|tara:strand:+ start:2076 stop:2801 length:726 start_codon:yes stop_codon:yes gene_type:complete